MRNTRKFSYKNSNCLLRYQQNQAGGLLLFSAPCRWVRHVLGYDRFLQEIFEGRMLGKSQRYKENTDIIRYMI